MNKLIFVLCSLFFVFAVAPLITGAFNQTVNSNENRLVMVVKIYNNQLSKSEKQEQEKKSEEFLKKETKPNALLPMPNPEEKLNFNGMPLPDEEKVEPKSVN